MTTTATPYTSAYRRATHPPLRPRTRFLVELDPVVVRIVAASHDELRRLAPLARRLELALRAITERAA